MGAKVGSGNDFAFQICVDSCRDIGDSALCQLIAVKIRELVNISAGLESEMLKQGELRLLTDDGNDEPAALLDHVVCQVGFIDREGNLIGFRCYLNGCIGDTSIDFLTGLGCQYEKSVGQFHHSFGIHNKLFLS